MGVLRLKQVKWPLFRGSSRFESLILSYHYRYKVTCECNEENINDDDDDFSGSLTSTFLEAGHVVVLGVRRLLPAERSLRPGSSSSLLPSAWS